MIYTFYSFKGGVGRSMALAGVAYLLAERGLRVLVIDFDLEAPGLERYYFEQEEAQRVRECPGLIDLILQYKRALTNQLEFERATFRIWRTFVTDAVPATANGGAVHLMPAGRREPQEQLSQYARTVRSFDWQDFFDNWNGAQFFDWLRAEITAPSLGYDVVLVDSRTGVTEMGGVCAYQLADVAVMLCAANYQNIDGTLAVARDFRSDAVLALRGGRPLELLVIPARLESTHPGREGFFASFEHAFATDGLPKALADAGLGYRELALPYDPGYAVVEKLVGDSSTGGSHAAGSPDLARNFGTLADALTLLAKEGKLAAQQDAAIGRLRGNAPEDAPLPLADPTKRGAGFDVFLDYALEDLQVAESLRLQLERLGISVARLDRELLSGRWSEALDRTLAYSQMLVVIFSEKASSPHREVLIRKAREARNTLIFPLLGSATPFSLLASFGLQDRDAMVLQDLNNPDQHAVVATRIRDALSSAQRARSEATVRNPYPGGRPFSEDDAPFFFGRDDDIAQIETLLRTCALVVVSGPSGIGKTSLVRAGVIPGLRQVGVTTWQIDYVDLAEPGGEKYLVPEAETAPRDSSVDWGLLVLDSVDSFAEDGSVEHRRRRFELVRDCIARESTRRKVLLCLRGCWTESEQEFVIGTAERDASLICSLQRLEEPALREIIVRPAQRERHLFESGLVDRLIADAGPGEGALPMLQMALVVLWNSRRRGWVTNQAYEATGGISGLVRANRDVYLKDLSDEEARRVTRFFSNLVILDSRLALIPEQCTWSDLESIEALGPDWVALRDRLAAQRLIVIDPTGTLTCELAIPSPYSYLHEEDIQADFMLWRQRFATYVHSWNAQRTLVQQPHLGEAELWYATLRSDLTASERAVIEASQAEANKAQQQEEQRRALDRAHELAKDAQTRLEEQHRNVDALAASGELRARANAMLTQLRGQVNEASFGEAEELIKQLHRARDYEAMGLLLEAVSRHDSRNARARRLYGQYFIETGRATAAIDVLRAVMQHLAPGDPEFAESAGLLGRAYKQVFLETADKKSEAAQIALEGAIEAYRKPYELDAGQIWHGANLLSLLDFKRRLNFPMSPALVPEDVARRLVSTIEQRQRPDAAQDPWELTTLAEAYVGLRDWQAVERSVRSLIEQHPQNSVFPLATLLRQFTEVWDLDSSDQRARGLVSILRAHLAGAQGANVEHDVREIGRLREQPSADAAQVQSVLGSEGSNTVAWWQAGLARAQSVASIRMIGSRRIGTGFLVRGGDLGLPDEGLVLLTNFHVLNEYKAFDGIHPSEAEIVFEAANPARAFRVEKILWHSPAERHDVTIARLSPQPEGIAPLPIAKALPILDGSPLVYIVGHGGGRDLAFSFQGNELMDHEGPPRGRPQIPGVCRVHYRAPTDVGSGGSPVFNSKWEVIAIHHKGAGIGMPRLNGVAGTYGANEGIAIQSIAAAIKESTGGPRAPSAAR